MTIPVFWNENWLPAVVNHLWQSTVVIGIAWLLTLALRNQQARTRHSIWVAASVKFLIPFSLWMSFASHWANPRPVSFVRSEIYFAMDQAARPFQQMPMHMARSTTSTGQLSVTHWLGPILAAVWLCGFIAVLALWHARWLRLSRVVRRAVPLCKGREVEALRRMERAAGLRRPLRLLSSPDSTEPGIFGISRPVLLWPAGISRHLEDEHMEAIFAHELSHVRRHDNLLAMMHMFVETLFWFHPLVWWVGARMVEEREGACDEEVLQACKRPQVYAEGILKVCEFCLESPLACVAGVTGADLKKRIVRIMTVRLGTELSLAGKMLLAAAALLILARPVGFGLLNAMQAPAQLLHPAVTPTPGFEVVTIKPSSETEQGFRFQLSPTGFKATHASLTDLIRFAYAMKSDGQLIGAPGWSSSEHFDMQAKEAEADVQAAKLLPMDLQMNNLRLRLQSVLVERFQLKTRFETRELPVYALMVEKGGIKMKEVEPTTAPAPGTPPQPGAHLPQLRTTAPTQVTASAWPINEMTVWLSHFDELGDRIVVNETGLNGHYDWVLNGVSQHPQQPDPSGSAAQEPVTSIFAALPEQLGLRLVPQKAPVEVLVIDHVEQPSPN